MRAARRASCARRQRRAGFQPATAPVRAPARARRHSTAGLTLMEVLIAVTLLSLLSTGMVMAMRIGLNVYAKANTRLMNNRRVAGAQRILEQELQGLLPVVTTCAGQPVKFGFFQGEPQTMRLATTFSLDQGWRGQPQLAGLQVIPGQDGQGVRLVVNELRYTGPRAAGAFCAGMSYDPQLSRPVFHFLPIEANANSFVLADKLAYCRFSYYGPARDPHLPPVWTTQWAGPGWPQGVRVDMAPLVPDSAGLQPITVVAPISVYRSPEVAYDDH
jgi:Prokaryotic N-terminal methylation motif